VIIYRFFASLSMPIPVQIVIGILLLASLIPGPSSSANA